MKQRTYFSLVFVVSLIIPMYFGCTSGGISSVELRTESISSDKAGLLESIKSKQLYCPGEGISGDLLLKDRYEPVILRDEKIVNDHVTNLMWQQDEDPERLGWKETEEYLTKKNEEEYAGYSDWRIPTTEELASLLTPKKSGDYYIDPVFNTEILSTWTCDEFPDVPSGAWFVDFLEGTIGDGTRAAGLGQVRLVRSFSF